MAVLKTNYKDDVLDTSVNDKRKYRMVQNADGTISLTDATSYTQEGSTFGAADINATNQEVNTLNENLGGFMFRVNEDGTEQKSIDGGVTWTNFSKGTVKELLWVNPSPTSDFGENTIYLDLSEYEYVLIIINWSTVDPYLYPETITMLSTNDDESSNVRHKLGNTVIDENDRYTRNAKVYKNGIWFSNGITNGGGYDSRIAVPQKIYGLKQGYNTYGADNTLNDGDPSNLLLNAFVLSNNTTLEYLNNGYFNKDYFEYSNGKYVCKKSCNVTIYARSTYMESVTANYFKVYVNDTQVYSTKTPAVGEYYNSARQLSVGDTIYATRQNENANYPTSQILKVSLS